MCHVSYDYTSLFDIIPGGGRVAVYRDVDGREFSVPVVCQLELGMDRIKAGRLDCIEVEVVTIDSGFDGFSFCEDHRNFVDVR